MITKGVVEEIVSPFSIRVRIPSIDRIATSTIHTAANNLREAIVSALPGVVLHLAVGDVVIVDIPDTSNSSGTILGYLYRQETKEFKCDALFDTLSVQSSSMLPKKTSIGEVTPSEIGCLRGVTTNIQKQLNDLLERIERLEAQ